MNTRLTIREERKCDTCGMWLGPNVSSHGSVYEVSCRGRLIESTTRVVLEYPHENGRANWRQVTRISKKAADALAAHSDIRLYKFPA